MFPKLNFNKYLCCMRDLTLATRLIAFIGVSISALLIIVLINDTSAKNFEISRGIALGLGLDWRHIHSYTNTSKTADPEGKIISAVLIFYSILFFLTNVCLLYGSVVESSPFAIPWLTCEIFGCTSKLTALIFHVVTEPENLSNVFIAGSAIYIVVMIWWWFVVFSAQNSWVKLNRRQSKQLETPIVEISSITLYDSPGSYIPNQLYAKI